MRVTFDQVYQPTGPKAMQDGMIEVKDRHAFVVFFKTDESGFVPVGQVTERERERERESERRRPHIPHDNSWGGLVGW